VTGRTLDEAKESALARLGIVEADAEVIVLSEGRTGLFGRLREEARVKARVRPSTPRPKRTRRPRGRREESRNGTAASGGRGRQGTQRVDTSRAGSTGSGPVANGARDAGSRGTNGSTEGGDLVRSDGQTGASAGRRRRARGGRRPSGAGDGQRPRESSQMRPASSASSATDSDRGEEPLMTQEIPLEEQADVAREFLAGLLGSYGLEASVTSREIDEDTVEVAAQGDGLGLLIGPRGTTLGALQEVTRTAVQRRFPARTSRILVDVAGYRQRRIAALQRFSKQVAEDVRTAGQERALEPMSPADRKVVHDTVSELDGVVTRSVGEEPGRYVIVAPEA
jgi:spoIIIJ-associated protein